MTGTPFELPTWDPCSFCSVLKEGQESRHLVRVTETTITLVNPRQFELGQMLVVPRRHAPTLLDLTDDEAHAVMDSVRAAGRALINVYEIDGITLYQNNGVASNQEVPHFHMHVVPRRKGGGWGQGPPQIASIDVKEAEAPRKARIAWEEAEVIARHIGAGYDV